jgi:hypothetical protein
MMTTAKGFFCNMKALNTEERARHSKLTEKLMASRKKTAETETGYEFQFDTAEVSLAELTDFVAAESRCCPFFDFRIAVEREGRLLKLGLTGVEGAKAFMRAEFHLAEM